MILKKSILVVDDESDLEVLIKQKFRQKIREHKYEFVFAANGWHGFAVLGTVFLVVTGGEALYADMGHFGRRPIRAAWYTVVMPTWRQPRPVMRSSDPIAPY